MRAIASIAIVAVSVSGCSPSKPPAAFDPAHLRPIVFSHEGDVDLQEYCRVVSPPKASSAVHLALTLSERAEHAHFTVGEADDQLLIVPHLILVLCEKGFDGRIQLDVYDHGKMIDRIVDESAFHDAWTSIDDMADWAIARLRASLRVGEAMRERHAVDSGL